MYEDDDNTFFEWCIKNDVTTNLFAQLCKKEKKEKLKRKGKEENGRFCEHNQKEQAKLYFHLNIFRFSKASCQIIGMSKNNLLFRSELHLAS